jgi:deoxyinosine 3'endonuclease (endonuclease V)
VAALAVLSFPALQLQHVELLELSIAVPYLPSFLGFR